MWVTFLSAPFAKLLPFLIAAVAQKNAAPLDLGTSFWMDPYVRFRLNPLVVLRLSAAFAQVKELREYVEVDHFNPPIS
jgi:hypothetical protein